MFSILNRALSRAITSFGNKFSLKKRSRLVKALDSRFYVKFMQLEIGIFTKLWQSCSDPHLKIRPIAIFSSSSLNYSLAACLQDNSRPKSLTKVETKRKLQQFTVSGWLIMNGTGIGSEEKENFKAEITFNMNCQYKLKAFVCMNHYFHKLLISS